MEKIKGKEIKKNNSREKEKQKEISNNEFKSIFNNELNTLKHFIPKEKNNIKTKIENRSKKKMIFNGPKGKLELRFNKISKRKNNQEKDNQKLLGEKDRKKKYPLKEDSSKLGIKFNIYNGSGDMIFPMVVLTAAHNVYDRVNNIYVDAKDIKLSIFDKNGRKAKSYDVLEYYFSEEYKNDKNEDYAILFLDKKENDVCPGFELGYYALKVIKDIKDIIGQTITLYGYPGNGNKLQGMEIKADGKNLFFENGIIKYNIDTEGGQSGSGLI